MALEDILDLIRSEAEEEAAKIIREAESKAANYIEHAKEQGRHEEKRLLHSYSQQAGKEKQRVIDNTRLEIKKQLLREKRTQLNDLYNKAVKKFENMKKEQYLSLIEKLIKENSITKNENLVLSDREKYINESFVQTFNKNNKGYNMKISREKGTFSGGFMLKTEKQQVDCSFDALIALIREEYEVKLSAIYFGEKH